MGNFIFKKRNGKGGGDVAECKFTNKNRMPNPYERNFWRIPWRFAHKFPKGLRIFPLQCTDFRLEKHIFAYKRRPRQQGCPTPPLSTHPTHHT